MQPLRRLQTTLTPFIVAFLVFLPVTYAELESIEENQKAWEDLLAEVWRTPLGQNFADYLFKPLEPTSIPAASKKIVDQLFLDSTKMMARIAALQLMTKDLYVHEKMDSERQKRLLIVAGDISARQFKGSTFSGVNLGYQAALIFIACLPYGSPLIRYRLRHIADLVISIFSRGPRSAAAITQPAGALLGREVLKNYSFGHALWAFINVFGAISTLQYVIREWHLVISEDFGEDHELLHGLEDYIVWQKL